MTSSEGQWSKLLLKLEYKLAKIKRLVPVTQHRVLSDYEDAGFRSRFYRHLWKNAADKLQWNYTDLGYGYWQIRDGSDRCVRGNVNGIELDSAISINFSGNKPLVHRYVEDIPGYCGPLFCEFRLQTITQAYDFLQSRGKPCVVKPANGTGAGDGVTTGVYDMKSLKRAAINAATYSKDLLIEDTVPGGSYRILVLGGRMISAIRRDPPQLTGDGQSTIAELIARENARRRSAGEIVSLFPVIIDQECINTLRRQSLTLKSVPDTGHIVTVKDVINQNAAEQNVDVSEHVNPEIVSTSVALASRLGLELAGVDVLSEDISRPLTETGGVINEVNGNPGLHHHYLVRDRSNIDVAETILCYCMDKCG